MKFSDVFSASDEKIGVEDGPKFQK